MGKNKANPSAMILSSTMMLRHLGLETQANTIASAVYDVIADGKVRTSDMHGESEPSLAVGVSSSAGNASTTEFTKAVLDKAMA